ncbi:hypothetical protein ABPG75_008575 [Micractinium tetrahymenae]
MRLHVFCLLCALTSAASGRSLSQADFSRAEGAAQGNATCVATAAASLGACSSYDYAGRADSQCCSALQALGPGCLDNLASAGAMGSAWSSFEAMVASCGSLSPPLLTDTPSAGASSPPLDVSAGEQPRPAPTPEAGPGTGPESSPRPQPGPESPPLLGGAHAESPPLLGGAHAESPPLLGGAHAESPPLLGGAHAESPPLLGGAHEGNCSSTVADIAASLCANATQMPADSLQLQLCCSTMQALTDVGCQAQLNSSLAAANVTGSSPLLPDVLQTCHIDMLASARATVGLASGALAAIVIGAVAVGAAAAALAALLLYRRVRRRRRLRDPTSAAEGPKTVQPDSPASPYSLRHGPEGCSSDGAGLKSGGSGGLGCDAGGSGAASPARASKLSTVPTKPRGEPPFLTASAAERFHAATPSQDACLAFLDRLRLAIAALSLPHPASLLRSLARPCFPAVLSCQNLALCCAGLHCRSEASRVMSQDALWSFISHYQFQATATSHAAATRGSAAAGSGSGPSRGVKESSGTPDTPRTPMSPLRSRGASDSGADFEVPFEQLQIVRPIGSGSFGRVFEARWVETPVACKVLTTCDTDDIATLEEAAAALASSTTLLAKLEEEAGLMVSLRHLNIVAYYGRCLRPPCIITEYCSRGSLACVLAAARRDAGVAAMLTWRRRLSLALDASRGMFYLHSRRCIHRDLKTPNLLVDENWRCKVSDFNLSRLLEDAPSERSSAAVTNPRWLAPEVLEGERATQAADTYSFGVCLWELLALTLPWGNRANTWQVAKWVMDGARPEVPPAGQVPGLPGPAAPPPEQYAAYTRLLARCWHQDPAQRPEFSEIVPRLRELLEQATAAAGEPPA